MLTTTFPFNTNVSQHSACYMLIVHTCVNEWHKNSKNLTAEINIS